MCMYIYACVTYTLHVYIASIYRVTSLFGIKSKVLAYGHFKSGSVELIICWKESSKFYIYRRKSACLQNLQSFTQKHNSKKMPKKSIKLPKIP